MGKIEIPQVANSDCDTEGPSPKAKSSKLSILLDESDEEETECNTVADPDIELAKYLLDTTKVPLDANPLDYWRLRSADFPRLSQLANRYLSIQATSASSERLFSTFGNTYEKKRMTLHKKTASAIVFLHHNWK